jgi:hypothetical protein
MKRDNLSTYLLLIIKMLHAANRVAPALWRAESVCRGSGKWQRQAAFRSSIPFSESFDCCSAFMLANPAQCPGPLEYLPLPGKSRSALARTA